MSHPYQAQPNDKVSTPFGEPVIWHVYNHWQRWKGTVRAKTWFEARALACTKYQLSPGRVEVTTQRKEEPTCST